MKFRKKPVVIEAVRWTGIPESFDVLCGALDADPKQFHFGAAFDDKYDLIIHTLEGYMTADPGDMIIKGIAGEFYPCKPDIFKLTYERETSK
jgi:hypothetical protein